MPLQDLRARPIRLQGDERDATVGIVAAHALCLEPARGEPCTGPEKLRRWQLAKRLTDTVSPVELSIEEAKLLQDAVASQFPPLVAGQFWALIESAAGGQ